MGERTDINAWTWRLSAAADDLLAAQTEEAMARWRKWREKRGYIDVIGTPKRADLVPKHGASPDLDQTRPSPGKETYGAGWPD